MSFYIFYMLAYLGEININNQFECSYGEEISCDIIHHNKSSYDMYESIAYKNMSHVLWSCPKGMVSFLPDQKNVDEYNYIIIRYAKIYEDMLIANYEYKPAEISSYLYDIRNMMSKIYDLYDDPSYVIYDKDFLILNRQYEIYLNNYSKYNSKIYDLKLEYDKVSDDLIYLKEKLISSGSWYSCLDVKKGEYDLVLH